MPDRATGGGGPRVAVVGVPGAWSTEALADALAARTGYRRVVEMSAVVLDLETGALAAGGERLDRLDGLAVKKISAAYGPNTLDRLELLRAAEAAGVRVFSPASRMLRLIDRLSCTVTLRSAGIPMPATVVTEDVGAAVAAAREYGGAVLKPLYSTKARGMELLGGDEPDLRARVEAFAAEHPMMYVQQQIELPGQDLGVVFVGGEYIGTYARVAGGGAWNTTVHSGGRYAPHAASAQVIDVARRAQGLFELDFTTVDVAETPDGPVVFEVSAFGGFRGARDGVGVDAAALYADHIMRELGR